MQKLPHELIQDILNEMDFTIYFKSSTVNTDGTITLKGVYNPDCESSLNGFYHIQPGNTFINSLLTIGYIYVIDDEGNFVKDDEGNFVITDDSGAKQYTVKDYSYKDKTITLVGTDPISVRYFKIPKPFFFHGTPLKQENELKDIKPLDMKTPMLYLMEPYQSENDYSPSSALAYIAYLQLCFLTEAENTETYTDAIYKQAIHPMRNLMEAVNEAILRSPLFYSREQRSNPLYHTNFGIYHQEFGSKKTYFSQNLAGCSDKLKLQVYRDSECVC